MLVGGLGIAGRFGNICSTDRSGNPERPIDGNLQLLCGGLGGRLPCTAHPHLHLCSVFDPDTNPIYLGKDGDPEWAVMTPEALNPYNGRSLQVFLPPGYTLPDASMQRLEELLSMLKPLTINLTVRDTGLLPLLTILDPSEDAP